MKTAGIRGAQAAVLGVVACCFAAVGPTAAQQVVIERCQPASIRAGSMEITLSGRGLENAKLWTSFPAKIERIDEKAPRFRITTDFVGAGAIRAHSDQGVSDLFFIISEPDHIQIVPCEKPTSRENAQDIQLPAVIEGASAGLGSHFYRFPATSGQSLMVHALARGSGFDGVVTVRAANENGGRLAFADDSDIHGADPWLKFTPPADGDYIIELMDSQYRGGLAYQLRVGDACSPSTSVDSQKEMHDESATEPVSIALSDIIYARFDSKGDQDVFQFNVSKKSFLTITPKAPSIQSPAIPRMKLTNAEGKTLAETPIDAFDERQLRLWLPKGDHYRLTVSDAFSRHGSQYLYGLELTTEAAPFELSVPRQPDRKHPLQDKFLAIPGGVFVVPVQCKRHQFDDAIALRLESDVAYKGENALIDPKNPNVNLRVRLPKEAQVGELTNLRVIGAATAGEERYEEPLRTRVNLQERNSGVKIPESVDGKLAVRVIESPVTVEISPPADVPNGGSANIPVKLVWRDEKRKFNTTLKIAGAPSGVQTPEKKLNTKDTTTGLELKLSKDCHGELKDLRVEVSLDYYKQPLLVESEPFAIKIIENDEKKKD